MAGLQVITVIDHHVGQVPAPTAETGGFGIDLFAQQSYVVAAEDDDVVQFGGISVGGRGAQDVGAGAHPDRVLLADFQLFVAIVTDSPCAQLRRLRRYGHVIQHVVEATGDDGQRQKLHDEAGRRKARRPECGDLVAIAQLGQHQQHGQQHADRQEGGNRPWQPGQQIAPQNRQMARIERQDVLGIGQHFQRQHEDRHAEQNGDEAGADHADHHPGDDFHAGCSQPKRRNSRLRSAAAQSPMRSIMASMPSLRRVKQAA